MKQILHGADVVLMEKWREELQHIVGDFERTCDRVSLKISVYKRKVLMVRPHIEKVKVKRKGAEI